VDEQTRRKDDRLWLEYVFDVLREE